MYLGGRVSSLTFPEMFVSLVSLVSLVPFISLISNTPSLTT
jgi:hypothetical protein